MRALEDISKTKIAVVGDVMLDRYWWGSVERISPEAPVPVVRLDGMSLVAGGAANVASNLAGLGATPFLFGIRGDDSEGEQLERVLIESEIKNSFMMSVPGRKTTIKTRIVAHHQHVVRIDQETHEPISNQIADEILGRISAVIDDVDVVILSDYAKGTLSDRLLQELIRTAREKSKIVVVDPKGNDFSKYAGVNVITPNKREAALATKLDPTSVDVVSRAGGSIMDSLGLDALLITEGEHGMTLFQAGQEPFHLDSLAQDVFDVTGAGDTVIATFAAAVAAGNNFVDSAKLANAAAGIVVGKVGTTRVTGSMLADFLATDGRDHLFESLHA
ncbi:MAG: D-glycero-beta-D-manno-heptose-7-phosphate kinase [Pyrinomonadaceae bacterium]